MQRFSAVFNMLTFILMMTKQISVVVCLIHSVVSGAVLLATKNSQCLIPVTLNDKILQLKTVQLC